MLSGEFHGGAARIVAPFLRHPERGLLRERPPAKHDLLFPAWHDTCTRFYETKFEKKRGKSRRCHAAFAGNNGKFGYNENQHLAAAHSIKIKKMNSSLIFIDNLPGYIYNNTCNYAFKKVKI
jgi:hypothetical protein